MSVNQLEYKGLIYITNAEASCEGNLNRVRVKVCGMTRVEDVTAAVGLGVDAIGFILHADSPRVISLQKAIELRALVPAFVNVVGVFVNAESRLVKHYTDEIGLDTVQLHGDETPQFAESLGRPYIKALRVQSSDQIRAAAASFTNARGLLLDPYVKGQHGGTGQLLDLNHWPNDDVSQPLILAGGLSLENVRQRVSAVTPYAVDVNSGVETSPGNKDIGLLAEFLSNLHKESL